MRSDGVSLCIQYTRRKVNHECLDFVRYNLIAHKVMIADIAKRDMFASNDTQHVTIRLIPHVDGCR